jgi:hypothetical protein
MTSDDRHMAEPSKLWWESPWVMIALIIVISVHGAVNQALDCLQ